MKPGEQKVPEKWMVIAMYIIAILSAGNGWLMYRAGAAFWQAHLSVVLGIFLLFVAIVVHRERRALLRDL